jgi:DNA-binding GntR family transcriptional regulator
LESFMDRSIDSGPRDADRVYEELREKVLTLSLCPGAILDEARVVQEMGTSRTPVREAVIRLVSEGLLRRDGRQIRVSSFEVSQLRAFFEAMTLMSRAVNRMAASRRTAPQLAAIHDTLVAFEQEVAHGSEGRLSELNHSFHKAIAAAADSAFIQKTYEDLLVESLRLARQCLGSGEDRESTRQEHLARIVGDHKEIYEAIKLGDTEAADLIATRHSLLFRERLSRQILGPSTDVSTMSLAD